MAARETLRSVKAYGVPHWDSRSEQPTLADAGIDKKLSSRAQKMAAVPEDEFEGSLGKWRERLESENERVTTDLLRAADKAERKSNIANDPKEDGCTVADLEALIRAGRRFGTIYAAPQGCTKS